MLRLPALAVSILAMAVALIPVRPTAAADMVRVEAGNGGVCSGTGVLNSIKHQFRYQVTHVPHLPDVDIADFYGIYQERYLPKTDEWPIARQYCGATVTLSDGSRRAVWYLIEYGMGFATFGDHVEFCVSGFDRWLAYDGNCRALR